MIRAAAAALLLLCALVDPVAGMKLPLTKGRFGALKKLLVYVGSVDRTTNVEQWSELLVAICMEVVVQRGKSGERVQ